jgi:hypothetical protein
MYLHVKHVKHSIRTPVTNRSSGFFWLKSLSISSGSKRSQLSRAGKILVLTLSHGDFWYKDLVRRNRQSYCDKHNYDMKMIEKLEPFYLFLDINWYKISAVLKMIRTNAPYEWVWLADLDMFIMNSSIKLENIINLGMERKYAELLNRTSRVKKSLVASKVDFILAKDNDGINFGSVLVRLHSAFVGKLFKEMWKRRWDSAITNQNEQSSFVHFMGLWKRQFDLHVSFVPQNVFNSYPTNRKGHKYKPGEFLVHFAGYQKNEMFQFEMANLNEYAKWIGSKSKR